jgi:hypothetical protein
MTSEPSDYGEPDYSIIANNIHVRLCILDEADRVAGRPPQWQSLEEQVNLLDAYSDKTDIWYLAENILKDEKKLIERDRLSFKVKLTQNGRGQCGKRIE